LFFNAFDIDAVRKNKDDIVSKLTSGIKALAKARGVQIITGYGRFVSNTQIKIDATDEVIEFEQAIIAAGSRVTKIPAFPFIKAIKLWCTFAFKADLNTLFLCIHTGNFGA
jgi:pyruvate/2-oxoglutarate dehydrogenase complex dihydrolipoamide dehydrogenase (E3) component